MNSRISYSFKMDIKFKRWSRLLRNISILLFMPFSKSVERKLIIFDNIKLPFNKRFGCKWFNHRWKHVKEENLHFCLDCQKILKSDEFVVKKREEKLDKLGI